MEEAAFPCVVLGQRFRVPVIYDMQSSLPEQLAQHLAFRSGAAQSALIRMERWLLRRADSVVSSAGLAERVRILAPGGAAAGVASSPARCPRRRRRRRRRGGGSWA